VPPSRRTDRHIPPSLDDIVLACLAKDPAARPPSAAAVSNALVAAEADVEPWTQEQAAAWWQGRTRSKTLPDAAVVA
jgi:serine/threonine-protein kinase